MSRIEDGAARWLRALDGTSDGRLKNTNLCENLAVFIGLQSQRTPRARASELNIDAGIARFGARQILDDRRIPPIICSANNIPYHPRRHQQIVNETLATELISDQAEPKAIESAIGVWRQAITPHLAERSWWLVSTAAPLLTSYEPVILVGSPGQPRGQRRSFSPRDWSCSRSGPKGCSFWRTRVKLMPPCSLDTREVRP